jgi:hypothetical protein
MKGNPKVASAAALRSAERRKREDEAPRLASEAPGLKSVRIEVVEHVPTGTTKHVRLIVVAQAPALFVIPCGDGDCRDGDHDLTREVMRALRGRERTLSGASSCQGNVRSGICNRHITYQLRAEYV